MRTGYRGWLRRTVVERRTFPVLRRPAAGG